MLPTHDYRYQLFVGLDKDRYLLYCTVVVLSVVRRVRLSGAPLNLTLPTLLTNHKKQPNTTAPTRAQHLHLHLQILLCRVRSREAQARKLGNASSRTRPSGFCHTIFLLPSTEYRAHNIPFGRQSGLGYPPFDRTVVPCSGTEYVSYYYTMHKAHLSRIIRHIVAQQRAPPAVLRWWANPGFYHSRERSDADDDIAHTSPLHMTEVSTDG